MYHHHHHQIRGSWCVFWAQRFLASESYCKVPSAKGQLVKGKYFCCKGQERFCRFVNMNDSLAFSQTAELLILKTYTFTLASKGLDHPQVLTFMASASASCRSWSVCGHGYWLVEPRCRRGERSFFFLIASRFGAKPNKSHGFCEEYEI